VALEDTIKEIREKVENGEAIAPNEGYEFNASEPEQRPDTDDTGN
jgi:hypothetical protein